jgi:DNA-directed RNA polymerase specialized sigma24 family protein
MANSLEQLEVVRAALHGDRLLLERLVRELAPAVHATAVRTLLKRTGHPSARVAQEAEDLTQEVLVQLFGSQQSPLLAWQPQRGLSLGGYVRLLTEHAVVDALRVKRRNPFTAEATDPSRFDEDRHPGAAPERLAACRQELGRIIGHLQRALSPRGFDVFRRLWLDAESIAEVCAATGQNPDGVYQWRRRIRLLLAAEGNAEASS